MKIDEHDVGRYRRQGQNSDKGKDNKSKRMPIIIVLVIVIGLFGAWYMGIIGGPNQPTTAQSETEGVSQPVADKNKVDISGDLSKFSTSIEALNGKVNFLIEANQRDNQQFKKINNELKQIRNGLGGLETKIKAAESTLVKMRASVAKIDSLAAGIEKIDSRTQAEITKIKESDVEISGNIEKLNKDLVNLDALYSDQIKRIEELESYLNNINARVTDLER